MDVALYRLEVLQGKESIVDEWLSFITKNKDKALETLKNEQVYFESSFKGIIDSKTFMKECIDL